MGYWLSSFSQSRFISHLGQHQPSPSATPQPQQHLMQFVGVPEELSKAAEQDQGINRAKWRRWTLGIMLLQVFHPLLNFPIKSNFSVLSSFLLAIRFVLLVAGKTTSANENAYLMKQQKSQYNRRVYYNHFSSFSNVFLLLWWFFSFSFHHLFIFTEFSSDVSSEKCFSLNFLLHFSCNFLYFAKSHFV